MLVTGDQPRRTALFRSAVFLDHETGRHPENASRLRAIDVELAMRSMLDGRQVVEFSAATDEAIMRVHDAALIRSLEAYALRGGGWLDLNTVVSPRSVDVARLACGAGIAAVDALIDGTIDRGFVLARPPGHHATPHEAMGFCLFNTLAVAVAHGRSRGLGRIAIIDWDVHHGNGTQDAFYQDPDVLYCSLHQSPLYPFSGRPDERGDGPGTGTTLNVPVRANTGDQAYLRAFTGLVEPAVRHVQPELLVVSAGYDAHLDDPIGGLRLTDGGFRALAEHAVALADGLCGGRLLMILEGGYDPATLGRCVADAIEVLDQPPTHRST